MTSETDEPESPSAGDAAWAGVAALYTRPGMAERCLALQQRDGTSVTTLLTLIWTAVHGGGAVTRQAASDVAALTEAFQAEVLRPLRASRDGLKRWLEALEGASALRQDLLDRELAAERLEQGFVLRCLEGDGHCPPDDPCGDACLSVARYLRLRRLPPDTDTRQILGCILSVALEDYDSLHIQRVLERALAVEG
ncbi:TIGR02444 family protein [Aquisalimonas lutea]|uniref:TIGR02444 family protein n=1 Tax=Aquisalimonas lutea TaxID=1327750 RepID=UPI0025B60B79|nr:TIGR02444 family protein [Aquisalimonas lutea]MDN3516762.1 TIGR02444 family protein [Aquisalimonas lutea]